MKAVNKFVSVSACMSSGRPKRRFISALVGDMQEEDMQMENMQKEDMQEKEIQEVDIEVEDMQEEDAQERDKLSSTNQRLATMPLPLTLVCVRMRDLFICLFIYLFKVRSKVVLCAWRIECSGSD